MQTEIETSLTGVENQTVCQSYEYLQVNCSIHIDTEECLKPRVANQADTTVNQYNTLNCTTAHLE